VGVKSLFLSYLQSYEFHVEVMFLFCFSLISLGTLEWILFNPFRFIELHSERLMLLHASCVSFSALIQFLCLVLVTALLHFTLLQR
jgi:hypothetical protein